MDTNRPDQPGDSENGMGDLPTAPLPEVAQPLPGPFIPPIRPAGTAVTDAMKARASEAEAAPPGGSYLGRKPLGLVVAAAALGVVVVASATAWGVTTALASSASAPTAAHVAAQPKAAGARARKQGHGIQGIVTGISVTSWTIRSAAGETLTVTVGSSTAYGTAKKPASASSFAVGERVGIIGTRAGDTVNATRVVHLGAKANPSSTTGTSSPAATPMPMSTS